jgi:hypothetical protein
MKLQLQKHYKTYSNAENVSIGEAEMLSKDGIVSCRWHFASLAHKKRGME